LGLFIHKLVSHRNNAGEENAFHSLQVLRKC